MLLQQLNLFHTLCRIYKGILLRSRPNHESSPFLSRVPGDGQHWQRSEVTISFCSSTRSQHLSEHLIRPLDILKTNSLLAEQESMPVQGFNARPEGSDRGRSGRTPQISSKLVRSVNIRDANMY